MRDVEQITDLMLRAFSAVVVRQLKVRHPGADDDGLWFFTEPRSPYEVQIESSTGMCPFLIETDENDSRITTNSVEETVRALAELLHLTNSESKEHL